MDTWRFLKPEFGSAFRNMSVDEAIMRARIEDRVPNTLRFYRWNPSSVSIGRFQKLNKEVHLENCMAQNIDVVRRITGGGAVYHDSDGEITYSIVARTSDVGCADLNMLSAYKKICNGLNEAVKILGAKAEFRPPEPKRCPNLAIRGRKFSGNAQFCRKGVLLQHGTFLLDIDYEKMFTFLKVPWAKTLIDVLEMSRRKLTSARQELESKFTLEDAYQALFKGFEKALKVRFVEEQLTVYEKRWSERLRKERYMSNDWTLLGKVNI